jgi:hypothetical protein
VSESVPSPVRVARRRTTAPLVGLVTVLALVAGACSSDDDEGTAAQDAATTTATSAVTGGECPYVVDTSKADFYPIQPSFSAGYTLSAQKLTSDTADWAYEVTADFPYSNWTAWYLYDLNGVPLYKFSDASIVPDPGSTNPFVQGNPILAADRSFTLYFMPSTTPPSVVSEMQGDGKNVALLPAVGSTDGVSIVSRSYWSFANEDLGDYDRFGYGGPTDTPYPTIRAITTDPTTGELTDTEVDDCGAQSELPPQLWYDTDSGKPVVTFEDAPVPTEQELGGDLPKLLLQTGSASGSLGKEFPPAPEPDQVQFYRNDASTSPYADVSSAPPAGNPPDACGGYVMANLPNDVVSLVHIPQVPSFPSYKGATEDTTNDRDAYDVQFYSVVIYGATKQKDAYGTNENSQLGNTQLLQNDDGSATVVLYPQSATSEQVDQIAAVVKANGWNLLRSGVQTAVAPNLLTIREKGQNPNWPNALSANKVTQGAPCPQSTNPDLLLPQDPPSAAVTQQNGMGLTAPAGQNCTIEEFLDGTCLKDLSDRLQQTGQVWSATKATAPAQAGG